MKSLLTHEMTKRIAAGLVLAPLTIILIAAGKWTFLGLMFVAALIALYEFYRLTSAAPNPEWNMSLALFYTMLCFASFIFIRLAFLQGTWFALCIIMAVWASDIGALIVGKKIGGPKLAPSLSPNKTWAGLGGAMIFCGLALAAFLYMAPDLRHLFDTKTGLRFGGDWWKVFAAGCFLGAVGQAGDLFKSRFKRRAGVKDSGAIIPGHGGLLDRIDALMLVSPVALVMLLLWQS